MVGVLECSRLSHSEFWLLELRRIEGELDTIWQDALLLARAPEILARELKQRVDMDACGSGAPGRR
eukprot:scaffold6155_cov108-Cylindrotheca_fusiformis.AAC.5